MSYEHYMLDGSGVGVPGAADAYYTQEAGPSHSDQAALDATQPLLPAAQIQPSGVASQAVPDGAGPSYSQEPIFQVQLPGGHRPHERSLYGSGDSDEGYTLEFPSLAAFQAWRAKEEEDNMVEFIKGDSHGSRAVPPRFKDHTKLVCARHCRSARKKYVKKYPERHRRVPSRKIEGEGCPASISYKTYYETELVRAMYLSEHSHPTGLENLPFTRRGRRQAEEERKRQQQRGYNRANAVLNGTASGDVKPNDSTSRVGAHASPSEAVDMRDFNWHGASSSHPSPTGASHMLQEESTIMAYQRGNNAYIHPIPKLPDASTDGSIPSHLMLLPHATQYQSSPISPNTPSGSYMLSSGSSPHAQSVATSPAQQNVQGSPYQLDQAQFPNSYAQQDYYASSANSSPPYPPIPVPDDIALPNAQINPSFMHNLHHHAPLTQVELLFGPQPRPSLQMPQYQDAQAQAPPHTPIHPANSSYPDGRLQKPAVFQPFDAQQVNSVEEIRWERLEALFKYIRQRAHTYRYPEAPVSQLEHILHRLYSEYRHNIGQAQVVSHQRSPNIQDLGDQFRSPVHETQGTGQALGFGHSPRLNDNPGFLEILGSMHPSGGDTLS